MLGQLWVGVPVTPELLYPENFSQDKQRNFYFQSTQFVLCLVIYSFSNCFPISSPPRSYKASINQQGLLVSFKHQDGRVFNFLKAQKLLQQLVVQQGDERHFDDKWMESSRYCMCLPITSLGWASKFGLLKKPRSGVRLVMLTWPEQRSTVPRRYSYRSISPAKRSYSRVDNFIWGKKESRLCQQGWVLSTDTILVCSVEQKKKTCYQNY